MGNEVNSGNPTEKMKKGLFIFIVFFAVATAFEFVPAVKQARYFIPEDVYFGKTCDCQCVAASRPWYGTFNYWWWLCLFVVPLVLFFASPELSSRKKMMTFFIASGLCYVCLNLAVHASWEIRNGPFTVMTAPNVPWQKAWDMNCASNADGASRVAFRMFGWLPAGLYAGFCYMILSQLRRSPKKHPV